MAEYIPSYTPEQMHQDDTSLVKVLMSAVGCGKTVSMLFELFFRGCEQEPNADGVRQTRWVVIRASYSQLKSTTLRTFIEWFGSVAKVVYDSPIRATIKFPLGDGTRVDMEFLFMSLDGDDSMDQLLSLEVTGGGINELPEIRSVDILPKLLQRCARYPSKKEGALCTWHGIVADMNPPEIGSHIYELFEEKKPDRYALYKYPPPIFIERDDQEPDDVTKIRYIPNPQAENWQHLSKGYDYWIDMAKTNIHDDDYVRRFVTGEYPFGGKGRPVYPNFSQYRHVHQDVLRSSGSLLMIGMDFGFQPCAAFCQYSDGRLNMLEEIVTEDCSLVEFLEDHFLPKLRTDYHGMQYIICGDPSGDDSTSTIDRATSYKTLKKYKLKVYKPETNRFKPRRDAVIELFRRREGFAVHPRCRTFIGGASSGYAWAKTQGNTSAKKPDKTTIYSHIQDAFQCVALYLKSGGEVYVQGGNRFDTFDYHEPPEPRVEGFLYL